MKRAHRLYELEGDRLAELLPQDPTYRRLSRRLAQLQARAGRRLGPEEAADLWEAHRLMLELTRDAAFTLGYVYAHTYPLDEVFSF